MAEATIFNVRDQQQARAVILIHGFSGDSHQTFGLLPAFLAGNPQFYSWDIHCFGYPTALKPDVSGVWAADPEIRTLADYLAAQVRTRYRRYKQLALVAHSMGGLIVQRATLDGGFTDLLSHMLLFGTPSAGLRKARWGKLFKRQVRDMAADSKFIVELRADWTKTFGDDHPFLFRSVAGVRDEFVPRESSVDPFPESLRAFVSGNHVEMVKPPLTDSDTSLLMFQLLAQSAELGTHASAQPELTFVRDLYANVADLQPRLDTLSEAEVRKLAFSLEATGQTEAAIEMLEQVYRRSTDLTGVLAGRLKRLWLADPESKLDEGQRAKQLYAEAYDQAQRDNDHTQASYNGINYAFMTLALERDGAKEEDRAKTREIAQAVFSHCHANTDERDPWRRATLGEAHLYLGDIQTALEEYDLALQRHWEPRERNSMQQQAIWATRLLGDPAAEARIEALFAAGLV